MKRLILVDGRTPSEFMAKYNRAMSQLVGFQIESEKFISDTAVYIFYEDPDADQDDEVEQIRQMAEAAFEAREPDFVVDATDDEYPDKETVEIRLTISVPHDRHCCECDNYTWRNGCPYRDGKVKMMDRACPLFNVILQRGC